MNKIVVYTAIFGAYDSQLIDVEYDREKFDFVCFTNQKRLKSNTWDIRYVEKMPVEGDNPRSAYYYKTNPHLVFGDKYEMSIWMDSSCNKLDVDKLYKMAEGFHDLTWANMFIEKHPGRDCVYDELEANCRLNKDDVQAMREHVETYRKEGMPKKYGMVETGLQFRKHNAPEVIEFQEMLWNEMVTKTRRDQLSWTYCAWKLNFKYETFTFQEKIDVLWFQDHPHRPNHIEKVLMVGPWYGNPEFESGWVEYVEEYLGKTPIDTVVVGCRPDRERVYDSIKPDKFFIGDPKGEINGNLLNGKVPRFTVKSKDKEIIQLNPTNEIFENLRIYDRNDSKIHVMWCTIRPDMFCDTYEDWIVKADGEERNWTCHVAVDTQEQKEQVGGYDTCIVVDTKRKGVTYPSWKLAQHVLSQPNVKDDDIVIFASDDFFPMKNWNTVLLNEFQRHDGALLVNDCYGSQGKNIFSIPIMTVATLKKLNGIIYHPAYIHCYSDNELYDNLKEMNLIKDISLSKPEIYFEHRHFSTGKRQLDDVDRNHQQTSPEDMQRYHERKKLPLKSRLEVKKVISFSLWGDNPKYTKGAIKNLLLAEKIYPGWVCRFYVDNTVPSIITNTLRHMGGELVYKDDSVGSNGLAWRFEVGFDNDVDRFVVRDTDSRLTSREYEAVLEWEKSGKPFHIMRDHENHGVSILGGMWGATKGFIPNFREMYEEWISNMEETGHQRDKYFNSDQIFLWQNVWSKIKDNHIAHDDRFNFTGDEKPFPSPLKMNFFVGQSYGEDDNPEYETEHVGQQEPEEEKVDLYEMRPGYQKSGLQELCRDLKDNTVMIEIGSFAGESTQIFLDSGKVSKIYCIDPWTKGYDDEDIASQQNEYAEKIFDKKFVNDERVVKIKAYSDIAVDLVPDDVDFVYVDGNHTYEWVKKDIENYKKKIKKDGLIGGHDSTHLPIMKALDECGYGEAKTFIDSSWISKV